jgi:hypothetical protein
MRTRSSFDYAVLRVVPRVERGEFVNAGVIVFCLEKKYLGARVHVEEHASEHYGRNWIWTWCETISRPSNESAMGTRPPGL